MKRSLIAVAILALSTASYAALETSSTESPALDRSLPTYPELGFDGWRNDAGEPENRNAVQIMLGELKYRFDAGEPTQDVVVQDYGSA